MNRAALGTVLGTLLILGTLGVSDASADTRIYLQFGPPAPLIERYYYPGDHYYSGDYYYKSRGRGPKHVRRVWTPGYYRWDRRYVWVPGQWARPPRGYSRWEPARWVQSRRGWYFVGGYWR